MKINYLILNLLAIFINFSVQKEYLVSSDFVDPTSNQTPGWSLPTTTYYCSNTLFSDWSGQKYYTGVLVKGQTQTKTINQLPPHWSLSVRFDLLLSGCVDSTKNDVFKIYIDNTLVDSYTKNPNDGLKICIQNSAQGTCNDELVLYSKNITHSSSSVNFSSISQTIQDRNVEGFCFKNFYLYVDTCDITCATCNGPASNQCLTCPANSFLSSNTCTCNSGYIQHQYQCVSTCPTGYLKSNTRNICIQDYTQNCSSSNTSNQICTACSSGYLYQGYCVTSCPQTSTLNNGVCVDFSASLINYFTCQSQIYYPNSKDGSYILTGLFNNYFGQSEILGLGLVISNFKGLKSSFGSSGALTTNCGTNHILGGFWLSGSGASISRSWTGLAPHWSIRVGYTLWKIDQWNNQNFIVKVDGSVVQQIPYGSNVGTSDFCGFNNQLDLSQNQVANFTHSSTTLTINFSTSLTDNVGTQSFGLSNLYVLVDYCTSNCITCGASGCLACQASYYLYNNVCVTSCPSSTYLSNPTTCVDCNSNCKTCNSPGNICTSCNAPNFLNPGNGLTCLPTCPVQYWPSSGDQICKTCDSSCYTCVSPGGKNSCTSCSGSLYLSNNQCIPTCPTNTYTSTATNNNQCLSCNSSCLTCNGPNTTDCLSCSSPKYLQPLQNSCVSNCNSNQFADTSQLKCVNCNSTCTTCSGPNNNQCLTCSGTYYFNSSTKTCVQTCPIGTYPNQSNNQCSSCYSNCTTCSGPAINNCLSCSGTLYLNSTTNTCVPNCPDGQYANSTGNVCSNCNSSCATCSGSAVNNCLSCPVNFYLNSSLKTCNSTCPAGTYKNSTGNICSSCNSSCATCSGGDSNNCLSCSGSLYFNSQSNSCVSPCPDGYFANSTGNICSACDSTCKTCSGAASNNCLSCSGTLYLNSNSCVSNCPSGKYQNSTSNTCSQCNASCATCSGPSSNNCLSCSNSLYLNTSNNTCGSSCPNGTYPNSSGNVCSACYSTCATCSGPLINNCLSCSGSLQYNLSAHTCTSNCPNGTYSSSGSCPSCNPNCFTCYGSQSNNCLSCTGALYLDSSSNSCTNTCPNKTYANTSNNTCSACDSSCTQCSGPNNNNCTSCSGSLYLNQSNNTCISSCPVGTYANPTGNICSACNASCTSCSGPNINNCLTCSGTLYLDSSNNTCSSTCPDGTYLNSQNNTCSKCNSTCTTCEGSASQCKSCSGSLYLDKSTNSCNSNCPQGTYQNSSGNICSNCDSTCQTCSGPNSNNCLSCSNNFYLNTNSKTCANNCPTQTYANSSLNICSSCNSTCQTCNGPASNNCLTCSNSLYLNQSSNSCVQICPQGTYPDGSTNICSKCDNSCFTCSGPSSNNCLSCSGSLFLSTSGNQCTGTCKTNEFQNKANNQCNQCDVSCLTCNGNLNTNCLSCASPLFLQQTSNTCTQNCNLNQYGQITPQRVCSACDSSCATCSGPNQNNCLSCSGSYYLDQSLNKCVSTCPSGTYINISNNLCSLCHPDCKTCSGPNNNQCLSCSLPKYFQNSTGQCLTTCNTNQFKEDISASCINCDVTCATCSGNSPNNCLTCSGSLFLNQNSNTCVSSCPDSYYQNTQNNQCSKCDITCATCNGATSSNCLTCNPPLSFQKSTSKCISTCASGQYLDVNTNKCTQCDSSCLNCIGGSKNQCVDCQSPRYYQKSTTSCELQCQPSYYGNSYTAMCEQCDSSCATCSGPKDNQCLSCKNSLFYLQASGTCVSNCPSGYFQNSLLNQCQKCDSSCKECSGTQNTQCTSCLSQLIFYNNQCLTQCPSGMFQSINQCALCDQSCETCNGQSSSSCLSCKPGMFLVSNQCLSSCPDGYYQNDNQCSKCHPSCKTCIGPNSTQCQTCVDLLIKYNSSCVVECPQQMYMIQTPYKQCLQCHFYCTSGCSGSTKEDCYEIKPIYQIIVYILVFKSFLWIISITVGFLKDNSQQALPLQKVAPLNIQKEAQQNAINNNQLDQKDKNSSLIEYQQNDPNLSPHSKIEDFNLNQGSKSPNIPVNQRGSIVILPQTNNNLMQSKNQLTFNNDANEEDISPNGIGRKRRSRKIDFILKTKIQNSPQKVQSIANMKTTILDQHFFPQDQTTANRSFVSAQNSPTKRNLLSLQNDKSKDQYTADEKLKYSFCQQLIYQKVMQ